MISAEKLRLALLYIFTMAIGLLFGNFGLAQTPPGTEIGKVYIIPLSPRGTYLNPPHCMGGDPPNCDHFGPPTKFDLVQLENDPDIQLRPGDLIGLQLLGGIDYDGPCSGDIGCDFSDGIQSVMGVFKSPFGFLPAGPKSTTLPIDSLIDDIPQDFNIPFSQVGYAQMPATATTLEFSPNDSWFKDNTDPNGDYQLLIAVTIIKNIPPKDTNTPGGICQIGNISNQSTIDTSNLSLSETIPLSGVPFQLAFSSDRTKGYVGHRMDAQILNLGGWYPTAFKFYDSQDGIVYSGAKDIRHIVAKTTPSGFSAPDSTGSEIDDFDNEGMIRSVRSPLTGAILQSFSYDDSHRLTAIADGFGNTTRFLYPHADMVRIIAPHGQVSTLQLDAHDGLLSVTNSNGETTAISMTENGLLSSLTKPNGSTNHYEYDSAGRIQKDGDPAGGYLAFSHYFDPRANQQTTYATSASGLETRYISQIDSGQSQSVSVKRPGDIYASNQVDMDSGHASYDSPYAVHYEVGLSDDPRFGGQVKYESHQELTFGGFVDKITDTQRLVDLADANDPTSVRSLRISSIAQNDPSRTTVSTYTAANQTWTITSPLGKSVKATQNGQGLPVRLQSGHLAATQFFYDRRGNLTGMRQGHRSENYWYNKQGLLAANRDALGRTTRYSYDPAGRVTSIQRPDGQKIRMAYDANGNMTSLQPPHRPKHQFMYNALDYLESYLPPALHSGSTGTLFTYNTDKKISKITDADGRQADYGYDSYSGLLNQITSPDGMYTFSYWPNTDHISELDGPGPQRLKYQYLGSKISVMQYSGPVNGEVDIYYDNEYRPAGVHIADANGKNFSAGFQYNKDSQLAAINDLNYVLDGSNLVKSLQIGQLTKDISYDSYGAPIEANTKFKNKSIFSYKMRRNGNGQITEISESANHHRSDVGYIYDRLGRLTGVVGGPNHLVKYIYDANGNRIEKKTVQKTIRAKYDDQDRLTQYGDTEYSYNKSGDLTQKVETVAERDHDHGHDKNHFGFWGWTWLRFFTPFHHQQSHHDQKKITQYHYDMFGNLRTVDLPDSTHIDYIIDAANQRVGKKVNGQTTEMYLYQSDTQIAAELDGSGNLISQFVYGRKSNVPEFMIKDGKEYKIVSDHLGSVRMVVDTRTGEVMQAMDYDEFGMVTKDTHPGFQPFGFAGGLYARDTGLVRFGARDYDPETGRWISKDPILFGGGDTNLYGYVLNDPVNLTDEKGLADTYLYPNPNQVINQAGQAVINLFVSAWTTYAIGITATITVAVAPEAAAACTSNPAACVEIVNAAGAGAAQGVTGAQLPPSVEQSFISLATRLGTQFIAEQGKNYCEGK